MFTYKVHNTDMPLLQTGLRTGLLGQTGLLGLTLLRLWQALLGQIDPLELMFFSFRSLGPNLAPMVILWCFECSWCCSDHYVTL